jgi:hypothetical protein
VERAARCEQQESSGEKVAGKRQKSGRKAARRKAKPS